jgi:solute carrier family 40 (iron-regulated transporter), member 1
MSKQYGMTWNQAYTLYFCHGLSAWNARSYEFAAVLFTTAAYPGGLKAASLIGLSASVATICYGSAIGRWIDTGASRLRTLLATILVNRITIIAACVFWFLIVSETGISSTSSHADPTNSKSSENSTSIFNGILKTSAFIILLGLGIIENLSRKANVISIERDWVPVLSPIGVTQKYTLTQVNATMARIDIGCKLIAPILVSWGFSIISSVKLCVALVALINTLSLGAEWLIANRLWNMCHALREPKPRGENDQETRDPEIDSRHQQSLGIFYIVNSYIVSQVSDFMESLRAYFSAKVWKPSLAMCITHASVLSVTSITVVFFLNSGYSLRLITIAEAVSAVFELSSTVVVPIAVKRLQSFEKSNTAEYQMVSQTESVEDHHDEEEHKRALADENVIRSVDPAITHVGFWGIASMVLILVPATPILLYLNYHLKYPIEKGSSSPTFYDYTFLSLVLLFCLCASRLGRGVFALATQQLAQSHVSPNQRSAFAGTEQAFVSTFGLGHNLGTLIWSEPSQFGWLALASFVTICISVGLYKSWMGKQKRNSDQVESFSWRR